MRHSKLHLERCEALWRLGISFPLEGQVARGFADLGYEEFFVLPGGKKIVSLLSGTTSEIGEDAVKNLFTIPSPDQSMEKLVEIGATSIRLDDFEERFWELTYIFKGRNVVVKDATLEGVLVEALIESSKI